MITSWDLNYNVGNVLKYIARYRHKGGADDLRKARQYLEFEIEKLERSKA